MPRSLGRLAAIPALVLGLATAAGFAQAHTSAARRAAACHLRVTVIAHGQGSPDDLAWDGGRLLVSDINQGTVGVVAHGRVRTLVSGLRSPEGIVSGPHGTLIIAAQGTNSVVELTPPRGPRTTLARLPIKAGQEGIDSIDADDSGAVFVPDSARGRLYVLQLHPRTLRLLARGLVRPVAAINWHGAIVVADEYASAVWRVDRHGHHTKLASLPLPDDLAVVSGHLLANSLAGAVWEVAPHPHVLSSAFAPTVTDPQGLAADGPGAVVVADQGRNTIERLSHLAGCL
jgi:streptogramin lyase